MKNAQTLLAAAVVLAVSGALHAQTVSVDKTTLNLSAQANGGPVSQTFTISSTGGSVNFGLLLSPSSPSWLKASPQSGSTPATITVTGDPAGLNAGTYNGQITVFTPTVPPPYPNVNISFSVGNIGVSPQALQFVYQQGATFPGAQTLTLTGQPTSFSVSTTPTAGGSWLSAVTSGGGVTGTSPATVVVSVNNAQVATMGVGTYNGTVNITPTSGAILTPISIPVTLTITGAPPVTVSPTTINLNYQVGGLNNTTVQPVTLSTTGLLPVNYQFQASVDNNPSGSIWINVNPIGGAIPANGSTTATVAYDTTKNLPANPNPYTGKVTVSTPGGTPTQQDISVRLLVSNSPLLNVPNSTLAFNYQVGGALPAAQSVTATTTAVPASSTTGQMVLTISGATASGGSWLVVPASGITGTAFSISVNPAGLAPGTYNGTVTVAGAGAGNGAQTIPVKLTVSNDAQVTATFSGCTLPSQTCSLLFPVQIAQLPPATQTVRVSSSTGAALSYSVTSSTSTCGSSWLVLGGVITGSTEGLFTVSANATGIAAGTQCSGTVTIAATNAVSGASALNSPITIPVTMYVSNSPLVSVNPIALAFAAQVNGSQTAAQSFAINSSSSTEQLNYTVTWTPASGGNTWLIFGPTQGSTTTGANVVTVLAQPGLLSGGTYSGNLTITATTSAGAAVADSPIQVPVTFTVNAGILSVTPTTTLTFNQTAGGPAPAAQTISVASSGPAISWSAAVSTGGTGNWLSISPNSGSTPSSISVTANAAGLAAGTYNGSVTVTATSGFSGGSPATVNVTLVVAAGTISAAPASLTFTQAQSGAPPANQTITLTGTPAALNFTTSVATSSGGNWLTATPASGTTTGTITVGVNGTGLALGQYSGTVTITSAGATGSPISIPVTLNVVTAQTLTVSPATVNFAYVIGNPAPAAQTVQLSATGGVAPFALTSTVSSGGNWLTVAPTSGSTPTTLTISVNPAGLAAGNYTGTISITSTSSPSQVAASITVNLSVAVVTPPVVTAIKSNASFALGPISAGENIVIGGTNLGPPDLVKGQLTNAGTIATLLSDTQVTFDGIASPILYAWGPQTSVMVPYEVANRATVALRVIYKGVQSDPVTINVVAAAPGIYTLNQQGSGPGAILNQDFNVNGAGLPAAKLSVVQVFMTGEGITNPAPVNGSFAPLNGTGLFKTSLPVTATVGGIPASVKYYGSAPGIVYGVMQVNVEIPANAPSGPAVPIVITVGTASTQTGATAVTVAVQ